MNPGLRILRRVVVCLLFAGAAVSMRAGANWASAGALGDVAIAFDNDVQLFANADGAPGDTISVAELAGTNAGLAFDASLNLLVTNTPAPGAGRLVTLASADPHGSVGTPITTQASPRSLAIAADGTIYVASPGGTIRHVSKTGTLLRTFSIATDSTACIGVDFAPDQSTLYMVSGGRTIRAISGVEKLSGPPPAVVIFATLPNPGTACGLRLLAPQDVRSVPPPPSTLSSGIGGVLVADAREIKRLNTLGAVVETFNAGPESASQKNWVDLALDPDTQAFWGIDAAQWRLAKFRIGAANAFFVGLSSAPRGVAVNGELRAAQTIRLKDLTKDVEGTATFLEPPYEHSWKGTASTAASLAIQAIEVTYDANGTVYPVCPPSLNVRCRLQNFDSPLGNPTPKTYSRGRSVFYREILRAAVPGATTIRITVIFPGNDTDTIAGKPCVVGITPQNASALLRDPFPHDLFSWDPSLVFYGGDDGVTTKTITFNDSIVVNRADGRYNMQLIMPAFGAVGELGRSLPIAVEVTDPATCNGVTGLESVLVLSVVDITLGVDTIIGDSLGIYGTLGANGVAWASVAKQYRTNLPLSKSTYKTGHTYRLCVMAAAAETADEQSTLRPPAGEVCQDVLVK
jgi:hypothetical protein